MRRCSFRVQIEFVAFSSDSILEFACRTPLTKHVIFEIWFWRRSYLRLRGVGGEGRWLYGKRRDACAPFRSMLRWPLLVRYCCWFFTWFFGDDGPLSIPSLRFYLFSLSLFLIVHLLAMSSRLMRPFTEHCYLFVKILSGMKNWICFVGKRMRFQSFVHLWLVGCTLP